MDDLADFLVENPTADATEDHQPGDGPADDADNPNPATDEGGPAGDDDDANADDDNADADTQKSTLKFKVPIKGEDGADTTVEVDEKELIAGYQRHADYTRKAQGLAVERRELEQVTSTRVQEAREYFTQQAQLARAAVLNLAGLKSPQELAMLAHTDPGAAFQEELRARTVQGVLSQLEQAMQQEQQHAAFQQSQAQQQEFHKAWGVLGSEGIDKPKLQGIFDSIAKNYGVDHARFAGVTDPKVVLIMRDAVKYRELVAKKEAVTKKVSAAPALPAARQRVPASEQVSKKLDQRFRTGKAGLNDLAAYINNSAPRAGSRKA